MKLFSSSPRFEIGLFLFLSQSPSGRRIPAWFFSFSVSPLPGLGLGFGCRDHVSICSHFSRTRLRIRVRFLSFPDPDLPLEKGFDTIVMVL